MGGSQLEVFVQVLPEARKPPSPFGVALRCPAVWVPKIEQTASLRFAVPRNTDSSKHQKKSVNPEKKENSQRISRLTGRSPPFQKGHAGMRNGLVSNPPALIQQRRAGRGAEGRRWKKGAKLGTRTAPTRASSHMTPPTLFPMHTPSLRNRCSNPSHQHGSARASAIQWKICS